MQFPVASSSPRSPGKILLVGAAVAILLIAGLSTLFTERAIDAQLAYLKVIAIAKHRLIEATVAERFGDAKAVAAYATELESIPVTPSSGTDGDRLNRFADTISKSYGYRSIKRYSLDTAPGADSVSSISEVREALSAAQRDGLPHLVDIHPSGDGALVFGVVAPVLKQGPASTELASALYLEADADKFILSDLASWPIATDTAEAVLLRQEGTAVRYISPLRFSSEAPGPTDLAPADDVVAQKAIHLNGRALRDGTDYRGKTVLGVAEPVAGTPWHVIVKIDRGEAIASQVGAQIAIAVLGLFTFGLFTYIARLTARNNERRIATLAAEADARTRAIFAGTRDALLLIDEQCQILDRNAAASDLFSPATPGAESAEIKRQAFWDEFTRKCKGQGKSFTADLMRQDGSTVVLDVGITELPDTHPRQFFWLRAT